MVDEITRNMHKLYDGRSSLSLEIPDYATFARIMQSKMRHVLCWRCPPYNLIRYKFPYLFENVVSGSLKSFFQLDQQLTFLFLFLYMYIFFNRVPMVL